MADLQAALGNIAAANWPEVLVQREGTLLTLVAVWDRPPPARIAGAQLFTIAAAIEARSTGTWTVGTDPSTSEMPQGWRWGLLTIAPVEASSDVLAAAEATATEALRALGLRGRHG